LLRGELVRREVVRRGCGCTPRTRRWARPYAGWGSAWATLTDAMLAEL
jgi:hypothetical protein